MLKVTIPATELWDEKEQEFKYSKAQKLQLEHSLVSISKWESKWCKPFLVKDPKDYEETIDYIKCMTLTQNVNPEIYDNLTAHVISEINNYVDSAMTATTITERSNGPRSSERTTSELIYYWMIALNIPFECQKWHLNRLLTLIKICNIKNVPANTKGKPNLSNRSAINAARKQKLNTKG